MKKLIVIISVLCCAFIFTGCGKKDEELEQYRQDMTAFIFKIEDLTQSIDNIDPNSKDSAKELLTYLDEVEAAFEEMAALEVPEHFANVEELADEAYANLSKAVSLYHQAFDYEEDFDTMYTDAAIEYYTRAFERLDYIGIILQGKLPEGDNITIVHDDEEGGKEPPSEDKEKTEQDDFSEEKEATDEDDSVG